MTTKELEKKLKISEKTCIHCLTLELAKQVLSIFHQLGLKWCSKKRYITYSHWDSYKENTVYYPFEGEYSSLGFAHLKGYKIIRAEEFIALHTEEEKFDLENYIPKGQLEGFPKEIIARMLELQEEQWGNIDVSVFEKDRTAGEPTKGFVWWDAEEGYDFWNEVIRYKNFALFFEKYPKKEEIKVCSKCHKEKPLSEFHKRGNTVRPECKECRKQEYQELKNNKNMQENNKKEEDYQEFRIGDKVIDIAIREIGFVKNINLKEVSTCQLEVAFEEGTTKFYSLEGKYYNYNKIPMLLHYRDDYNYDVIDFNNLPKRQEAKSWRAKKGDIYYSFTSNFKVEEYIEVNDYFDNEAYNSGNYFRTEVEAQEVADKLKKYFQELVNPNK